MAGKDTFERQCLDRIVVKASAQIQFWRGAELILKGQ